MGKAITLVSQFDVKLIQAVEERISKSPLQVTISSHHFKSFSSAVKVRNLWLTWCLYFADTKLKEFTINEKEVCKILLQVGVARREAEIVSNTVYNTSLPVSLCCI